VTAMTPVSDIITLTALIDHLARRGLGAGEAAEIAHKAFRLGIESVKPKKKPKQLGLVDKEVPWPEGFCLNDKMTQYAIDRGFSRAEIDRMWDRFSSVNQSKGRKYIRWDQAWRTWVTFEHDRRAKQNAPRAEADTYIDGRL
jgi:hypothetical protein